MSFRHPSGIVVDVYGLKEGSRGRSCECHDVCGSVVEIDTCLRFLAVQIMANNKEETAIAAYWVTDGVDRCRVGFLPRYCVKHKADFDGKLAQVTKLLWNSSNKETKSKSHRNRGVITTSLIEVERTGSKRNSVGDDTSDDGGDGDEGNDDGGDDIGNADKDDTNKKRKTLKCN